MKQQAQSLHPILEKFLADLPVRQPLAYKAVYPKRILTPTGFMSPEYYALTLWSQILVGFDTELNMLPHLTGLVSGLMQLEYRVPTYFVRSEFAQAVAQTEPPADFKLSEIRWPLPAMLFVLPTDFVLKTFGHLCPFISVSKAEVLAERGGGFDIPAYDPHAKKGLDLGGKVVVDPHAAKADAAE